MADLGFVLLTILLFYKYRHNDDYHAYSTIVLYRKTTNIWTCPMKNITQKPASLFPDDDEAVLVI